MLWKSCGVGWPVWAQRGKSLNRARGRRRGEMWREEGEGAMVGFGFPIPAQGIRETPSWEGGINVTRAVWPKGRGKFSMVTGESSTLSPPYLQVLHLLIQPTVDTLIVFSIHG